MSSIKKYILEQVAKRALSQDDAKNMLLELAAAGRTGLDAAARVDEPIAIIGMAGRFPRARNAEEFWQLLRNGVNCIGDFPAARTKDFDHILRNPSYTEFLIGTTIPAEHVERAHAPAGYMEEIDKFDARFFGIPPAEATFMDPHQRAALEVSWEAMEDAGYGGRSLFGSNTGVFIGKEGTNYSLYRYCTVSHPMQLTGSWESVMASRISYLFDFSGPCMLVDTACSAGLVSVHMAAQAILNGDCDQALAGGINLSVTGEFGRGYQGSMAMDAVESRDSVIRTFDARANGTVWGEGVAMVMLKRLSRAIADRDPIHAVILGSAINNDGASSGLTAPDAESQQEVIVRAWQKAGIDPATLSYVEAHGTGTVLGDPIEFKGLSAAFRRYTRRRQFCAIGSLKTNMGHLVAASGVASLFKVVKSLEHRELAPTINFGQPNPYINFLGSPLYVSDTLRPWAAEDGPRRAALSSFGFSHTNCHMVVEEAPLVQPLPHGADSYLFTLSAQTRAVLLEYVERLRRHLQREPADFADVCYTLNVGRGHYAHRLAFVADSAEQLLTALAAAPAVISGQTSHDRMHYSSHVVVSDKKRELAAGELTDKDKKQLTERAAALVAGKQAAATLDQLARLYVAGAEPDWARWHRGEARRRVALPPYPFQRVRVWADPKITRVSPVQQLHPLVQRLAGRSAQETIFESMFSVDAQWVLADHRIEGRCVVPGTTYLEMVRVAAEQATGWHSGELCDVYFLVPMMVEPEKTRQVRLRLLADGEALRFDIESLSAEPGAEWQRHVEGRLAACAPVQERVDIEALKRRATETIEHFVAETDTGVFQFGPHWDAIRSAWRIGEDALARLALPASLAHEMAVYKLHPAVLDNAVNLISQSTGATYLPFSYKSFRFYAPLATEIYSHVVSKRRKGSDETLSYDIVLCDAQGQVLVRISDYVVKKVARFAGPGAADTGADGEYLLPRWVPTPATGATQTAACRKLLLVGADAARHSLLIEALTAAGVAAQAVEIGPAALPAKLEALTHWAAGGALQDADGIVFVVDGAGSAEALADAAVFARRRELSVDALFLLTRALLAAKAALPWGLAVLTYAAYEADGREAALDPLGAATQALGSVIGMEYRNLPCRLLDAGPGVATARLAQELLAAPAGRITAVRTQDAGVQTLVRELAPVRLAAAEAPTLREDGFYLITGGLGGLGLALARDLARRGRVRVVLTGRLPLTPRLQWAQRAAEQDAQARRYRELLALEPLLAALDCRACDIADAAAVEDLLAQARAAHGPLRGLFHLAGVAGDGFLLRKEPQRFDAVLRPKMQGLRNLYAATARDAPDCFVLFSSIVALTGGEGQGDYAAANAFMDGLAWAARRDGRRLISLNWPSWKDVGMAAGHAISEEETPFLALGPDDALARLQRVLAHAPVQILPSAVQPAAMAAVQTQLPFVLAPELRRRLPRTAAGTATEDGPDIEIDIRGKNAEDLTPTEIVLVKIYAAVLGLAEIDVYTSFYDMGGNSIIATHLLKLIDSQFPRVVDISDVFSYPSIDDMAAYIDEKQERHKSAAAPTADEPKWEVMLDGALESDGALDALLDRIQ